MKVEIEEINFEQQLYHTLYIKGSLLYVGVIGNIAHFITYDPKKDAIFSRMQTEKINGTYEKGEFLSKIFRNKIPASLETYKTSELYCGKRINFVDR